MPIVEQLRGFRVLEGFSLQQLASLAAEGEEFDAQPGDALFHESQEAKEMIFLLDGKIELRSHGSHIYEVPPLSLIGEMGVLLREPRVATAIAVTPCRYLSVKGEDFCRLTEEDPDLGLKLYRSLCAVLMEQLKRNNLFVEFLQVLK